MVIYKYLILLFVYDCWHYVRGIGTKASLSSEQFGLKEGSPCVAKDTKRNMTGTCITLFKCSSAGQASINTKAGFEHEWPPIFVCSYKENGDPIVCCTDCLLDNKESLKDMVVMQRGTIYNSTGPKAWQRNSMHGLKAEAWEEEGCMYDVGLMFTGSKTLELSWECIEYYSTLPYRERASANLDTPYWDDVKECVAFRFPVRHATYLYQHGYGGVDAKPQEFPHMVLLGYGPERDSAQWLCGGSIISERFILSAAHCSSAPKLGNVTFAGLGILKRTDLSDYWRIYKIKTIINHPEYRPPSKYHDIMLLETATEINFGSSVLPACLETGKSAEHYLLATGWGRQSARGALDNHLQVMSLNKYNESICSALFPPHRLFKTGYNHTIQMCYGREDKIVDTCEGDSGGPLQSNFATDYHHIVGITSFGKDCGIPGNAGMYTRVRYYVPWIESIVWKDE